MPLAGGDHNRADWNNDAVAVQAVTAGGVRVGPLPLGNYLMLLDATVAWKRGDASVTTTYATGNALVGEKVVWQEIVPGEQYIYFITDTGDTANVRIMNPGDHK